MESLELIFGDLSYTLRFVVYGFIVLEWLVLWWSKKMESHKEGWVNMFSYGIESLPYLIFGRIVIFGIMQFTYEHRFFSMGSEWYVWILAFLVYDLAFYIVHFLGHQVRLFWCIHGVHHTAEEMKLTVAIRGSFLGFLLSPHTILWLPLFGFNPFMIFIVDSISRFYGLYEHVSDKIVGRQPWLDFLFITPSSHRVHHAKNAIYLDRNYGEAFSIWDRLFGTFQKELESEKPQFGIINDKINSKKFWQVQLVLWKDLWNDVKAAPRWLDKVKYIFYPPGWNHIDGGKLAHVYRNEALKELKSESK